MPNISEIRRVVQTAFEKKEEPPVLPPKGTSRDVRRKLDRERSEIIQRNGEIDLSRRRVIKGGLVTIAVVGGSIATYEIWPQNNEVVYSGEVEETKTLIDSWDKEVGNDAKKLEKYLPKIAKLITSFFCKDMGYDTNQFADSFVFLDRNKLSDKAHEIDPEGVTDLVPGFSDVIISNKIYINQQMGEMAIDFFKKPNGRVKFAAYVMLHELFHIGAPLHSFSAGRSEPYIAAPVYFDRGLAAYGLDKQGGSSRRARQTEYRYGVEEIVVDQATSVRAKRIGIPGADSSYEEGVRAYEEKVLRPLYNGDEHELLQYHQTTQPEKFFQSIGEKLGGKTSEEQAYLGNQHMNEVSISIK